MTGFVLTFSGVFAALAWLWLAFFRGKYWRADQRLPAVPDRPRKLPPVVAVVPARNESATVAETVTSLLEQETAGGPDIRVVLVDDASDDGTAETARAAAAETGAEDRLRIVVTDGPPEGWTGKLWAVRTGLEAARSFAPKARYVLLTDADIRHPADGLLRLVGKAEADELVLTSLMVKLRCVSYWERLLVPAFVYFFQKLYPFSWVNDAKRLTAAAAGGCMLVRRDALDRAGGVEAIRGEVIDDVALAKRLKGEGAIWLGLAEDWVSLRSYEHLADLWRMVARTAFVQLRRSTVLLLATVVGLTVLYLVPPAVALWGLAVGHPTAEIVGAVAWVVMAMTYAPTLRLYGLSTTWALTLPLAGLLYTLMTIDSARRHWQGRGGAWKGRTHA